LKLSSTKHVADLDDDEEINTNVYTDDEEGEEGGINDTARKGSIDLTSDTKDTGYPAYPDDVIDTDQVDDT